MKIKVIAIITVFILILMYVPVYADTAIPDPPYGSYQYWVVADEYGVTTLFTSPNPMNVDYNSVGRLVLEIYNIKSYVLSGGNWSYDFERMGLTQAGINTIYAANHDIPYKDGSGFFFTPPKVSELCQIVRQAKNRGDFGKIWTIILDGLIPLVGLLILGISLRKGWAFLQGQLRH